MGDVWALATTAPMMVWKCIYSHILTVKHQHRQTFAYQEKSDANKDKSIIKKNKN